MRERRCFVRVPVGVEVSYQTGESATPRLAMSEDISQEGMRISQPELLERGTEISISFVLPSGGRLELAGKVVWCSKWSGPGQNLYHAGLRWLQIHAGARAHLNAFLIDRIEPGTPIMGIDASLSVPSDAAPEGSAFLSCESAPPPLSQRFTATQWIHWGTVLLGLVTTALAGALIGFWLYPK